MKKNEIQNKVISLLESNKVKMFRVNEIAKYIGIKSDTIQYDTLKEVLEELSIKNILSKESKKRYSFKKPDWSAGLTGKIIIDNQLAYLTPLEDETLKFIISHKDLHTALNGDLVRVVALPNNNKKKKVHGKVIEVLERNTTEFIGTLELDQGNFYIIPDNKSIRVDFVVSNPLSVGIIKHGDKVKAQIVSWKDEKQLPTAKIISNLGTGINYSHYFDSFTKEFELPAKFNQLVNDEAEQFAEPTERAKYKDRIDFRNEIVFTIDPPDAKDFDDALSIKKLANGNFEVGIHIADVSHYILENSEIDIEARNRGNSTYLVDRVVPMLPENLSNNICSLVPNKTRLTYSVIAELGAKGALKSYKIAETVIKSKRRFSYDEALEIINSGEGDFAEQVLELNKLANILRKKRFSTAGIEFETKETRFVLNENKEPVSTLVKSSNQATQLVEEFMLLANKLVAMYVEEISKKRKLKETLPFLYRVHEEPDVNTINQALDFISSIGKVPTKLKKVDSNQINQILRSFKDTAQEVIVNQVLIRSMPKAIYSNFNVGHFGLGFQYYTHFTSPIRRYSDLVVHRTLKEYISGKFDDNRIEWLKIFVKNVGFSTTSCERLAMEAERACTKLASAMMAKSYTGKDFIGTVSGVTNFGIFVLLDDIQAEGLLHVRDLTDDHYTFDEKKMRLFGRRTKRIWQVGSRLKIRIAKVNIDKRMIDLKYEGAL